VSNPPGAEVLVDERSYGATPVEVTLTGNWWESRIKGVLGTDSEPVVVEVSSKELIDAFDRKACIFGDLIIDVSAERASTPSEVVISPQTDEPQDRESTPTSTTSEDQSVSAIQEADSLHPGTGSATDDDEDSLLPYIFMGAGGVLLAGGLVTGIMYLSDKGQLQDNCDDSAKSCDADQESNLEEAKTLAVATDVLLLTGLASLVAGIVLKIL